MFGMLDKSNKRFKMFKAKMCLSLLLITQMFVIFSVPDECLFGGTDNRSILYTAECILQIWLAVSLLLAFTKRYSVLLTWILCNTIFVFVAFFWDAYENVLNGNGMSTVSILTIISGVQLLVSFDVADML